MIKHYLQIVSISFWLLKWKD